MGDVADVDLGLDGRMETAHAKIFVPPGVGKVPGKGQKIMARRCPCSKILQAHHVAIGGGMHQVSGGVHRGMGILRLSQRVNAHLVQQLVHGGGLGENVQKTKGRNPEAEFSPQICGLGLPPHVGIARRTAEVKMPHVPPPPFISSEPPLHTEPLPGPRRGVMGNRDPDSYRVEPSQPPINFVDGNGYIVLQGTVEARDGEGGWNKVMKAWGSGDEKVLARGHCARRS